MECMHLGLISMSRISHFGDGHGITFLAILIMVMVYINRFPTIGEISTRAFLPADWWNL